METLDEFDINIIKELEKDGRMAYSAIASNLKISNTMVHQRINRLTEQGIITGIKPVINEKKIGYDWGAFTGITLKKDHESDRVIEALKNIPEITECYYITGFHSLYKNDCKKP
jgi:Lrp/AsnC family transcriptional regulator for asnA, asnC and gidA